MKLRGLNIIFIIVINFIIIIFPSAAYAQSATLGLSPSAGTINKGCDFSLDIELNTAGAATDGTDAILVYDTSRLTATSVSQGTLYSEYPGNSIDDSAGKVVVSGLASVDKAFTGTGTLATVNFLVENTAPAGTTQVKFEFAPGSTTDSIVVQRSTNSNILSSVTNGNYTIGTGSCSNQTGTSGSNAGAGSSSDLDLNQGNASDSGEFMKKLPPAGSETLTYTFAIVGFILTVFGILGLVLL